MIVEAFEEVADILGAGYFEGLRESPDSGIGLFSVCPGWNGDLRWISSGNKLAFDFFDQYFSSLKIAKKTKEQIGPCGELIMYSGFFVVRSRTTEAWYHVDYSVQVALNAFTLMTPVIPTGDIGNLLYHDVNGQEKIYQYQCGRGVSFGGGFYHSTEPFESGEPYVFLCFTYGVTDMAIWPTIAETAAEQGLLYRHPSRGIVKAEG